MKAFIRYKRKNTDSFGNLESCQKELKNILLSFDTFCKENQISYSLSFGSLIGAARHHDIIPWDNDIDIMMDEENFCKLKQSLKLVNNFGLNYYNFENCSHINTEEIRIYKEGVFRIISENKKVFFTPLCLDIFCFSKISASLEKKHEKLLKKIHRYKRILTYRFAKYDSKNALSYMCRQILKILLVFFDEKHLHKTILKLTKLLYVDGDYKYFSSQACEHFNIMFDKKIFKGYELSDFGSIKIPIIKEFDYFLTKTYGDWKKPYNRSEKKVLTTTIVYRV